MCRTGLVPLSPHRRSSRLTTSLLCCITDYSSMPFSPTFVQADDARKKVGGVVEEMGSDDEDDMFGSIFFLDYFDVN